MKLKMWMAVVAAAALAAPAVAQDDKNTGIQVRGGYAVPLGDLDDAGFDGGINVAASLTGRLTDSIDWKVDGGYQRFTLGGVAGDLCDAADLDCSLKIWNGAAGVQLHGSRENSLTPYVYVLAGAWNTKSGDDSTGGDDSSTDFGAAAGLGVEVAVGESWGVVADGRFTNIFADDSVNYITVSGGFHFRF